MTLSYIKQRFCEWLRLQENVVPALWKNGPKILVTVVEELDNEMTLVESACRILVEAEMEEMREMCYFCYLWGLF